MNLELMTELGERNGEDIATIINKVGIKTIMALLPNILNILKTIQTQPAAIAPEKTAAG